jgi:membrane associated rhomboid family serine protease
VSSSGGPDLFVVCKHCGAEVSPYVTECPYCGNRIRKRAPKLDRAGEPVKTRKKRAQPPKLPKLRRGEIPGIQIDRRPYATILLVAASILFSVALFFGPIGLSDFALRTLEVEPWRVFTAPLVYVNAGYQFAALGTIAVFGWLLERRHGPAVPILLFLLGGAGGMTVAAAAGVDTLNSAGGNGAALAMVSAWAMRDVLYRKREEIEGDLLGAGIIAIVLLLLPLVTLEADPIAGVTGLVVGTVVGTVLAQLKGAR